MNTLQRCKRDYEISKDFIDRSENEFDNIKKEHQKVWERLQAAIVESNKEAGRLKSIAIKYKNEKKILKKDIIFLDGYKKRLDGKEPNGDKDCYCSIPYLEERIEQRRDWLKKNKSEYLKTKKATD